ncbi:MAG: hypothetical protein GY805_39015 [Chloroflexi bacterium]|nr:hypothetical protein [Chloroflexota bacterium]
MKQFLAETTLLDYSHSTLVQLVLERGWGQVYAQHGANLGGLKSVVFKHLARKQINARVSQIRLGTD